MKQDVEIVGKLIEKLKCTQGEGDRENGDRKDYGRNDFADRSEGSEWRALRSLLDRLDPAHIWRNLKKVHNLEGHYLWLCPYHAKKYRL